MEYILLMIGLVLLIVFENTSTRGILNFCLYISTVVFLITYGAFVGLEVSLKTSADLIDNISYIQVNTNGLMNISHEEYENLGWSEKQMVDSFRKKFLKLK